MAAKLDLSVPEAPRPGAGRRVLPVLTFLVAAATLGLVGLHWRSDSRAPEAAPGAGNAVQRADVERLRGLAQRLERRTLYREAAEAWKEYAAVAGLSDADRASIVYRQGKCLHLAGDYAGAARALLEAEQLGLAPEQERRSG